MGNPNGRGGRTDRTGQIYNRLTVVGPGPDKVSPQTKKLTTTWVCQCECGKQVTLTGKQLKRGQISCGCHKLIAEFRSNLVRDPANGQWVKVCSDTDLNVGKAISQYKTRLWRKSYGWELSYEEAKTLLLKDCHYCGSPPSREMQAPGVGTMTLINGIDRLDSLKGYIYDNVVPCCKRCNQAKNTMTVEEFKDWGERLWEHWLKPRL